MDRVKEAERHKMRAQIEVLFGSDIERLFMFIGTVYAADTMWFGAMVRNRVRSASNSRTSTIWPTNAMKWKSLNINRRARRSKNSWMR